MSAKYSQTIVGRQTLHCDFCPREIDNSLEAHRFGWTWFTGHLPDTVHVCQACRKHYRSEMLEKMAEAGVTES